MRKLIYAVFIMAGISIASINVANAQDTKSNAACCSKEKAASTAMKSGDCPMKAKTVSLTSAKADDPKGCPMAANKDCLMTGTKACPKDCPMKSGAVTENKSQVKKETVAEAKVK